MRFGADFECLYMAFLKTFVEFGAAYMRFWKRDIHTDRVFSPAWWSCSQRKRRFLSSFPEKTVRTNHLIPKLRYLSIPEVPRTSTKSTLVQLWTERNDKLNFLGGFYSCTTFRPPNRIGVSDGRWTQIIDMRGTSIVYLTICMDGSCPWGPRFAGKLDKIPPEAVFLSLWPSYLCFSSYPNPAGVVCLWKQRSFS